jgi:hypothetical protein
MVDGDQIGLMIGIFPCCECETEADAVGLRIGPASSDPSRLVLCIRQAA